MITDWQIDLPENSPTLAQNLKNLMQSSSLTAALSQYSASFDVELRYLGLLEINQKPLNTHLDAASLFFVREVFLRLNQIPVVWAISICHKDDMFWQQILNRGNQSLGNFLFEKAQTGIKRSAFAFSYQAQDLCPNKQILWSRRSVFEYNDAPLNLQEVFLPELLNFIE